MSRVSLAMLVAAVSFATVQSASAAPLAVWNFNDNDGVVDTSTTGFTTTTFTGTPGLIITNLEAQGGSSTTTASTVYWQVAFSSGASRLSLDELKFDARVFQQGTLRQGFVDVRVDSGVGFGGPLPPTPYKVTSESPTTVTVPLAIVIEPGGTFTTRFYLLNDPNDDAPNLQARLALDNVKFNGTVPEPSTLALAAAVGMGLLLRGRRRRTT